MMFCFEYKVMSISQFLQEGTCGLDSYTEVTFAPLPQKEQTGINQY